MGSTGPTAHEDVPVVRGAGPAAHGYDAVFCVSGVEEGTVDEERKALTCQAENT